MAGIVAPLQDQDQIRAALARLDPATPWTHHFNIQGVETISAATNEKFYKKSIGLKKIGELALQYCRVFSEAGGVKGLRVLDVASAEGGQSIAFARAGAREVVGIEGRRLYVDRANFVTAALGVENAKFSLGDVRKIDVGALGEFDFVICSGILHHLGAEDFLPFLKLMGQLTRDTFFLYTHVSNPDSIRDFGLAGPHEIATGITGYLFREHADGATASEKEQQVRASLDNTFSFWATEESLVRALSASGFRFVAKMFEPHAFGGYRDRNIRVIFVAKK
jgi:hypothetical protein